jgi:hypothetical protein
VVQVAITERRGRQQKKEICNRKIHGSFLFANNGEVQVQSCHKRKKNENAFDVTQLSTIMLCQHIFLCKFTLDDRVKCLREISSLRCFIHDTNACFSIFHA